jgi:aminoglycoside phosphotransferase (APT) family kinase protein
VSVEEAWQRGFPLFELEPESASRLIGAPVREVHPLSGGLRNTNYRLTVSDGPVVLRVYTAEAGACAREAALLRLLVDSVPVPRVLQAEPQGDPPWALLEFVDGVRFDRQPPELLARACYDAGHVLARIHAFPLARTTGIDLDRYARPGYGFVEFIESTLRTGILARDLGPASTARLRQLIREYEPRLSAQDATLQHSDYKPWNLLARDGHVAAVVDWEFAFGGPRLNDIANFLRYSERQPPAYRTEFVRGYLDGGGVLPDDWFRLARLGDLMGLCETLSRRHTDPQVPRDLVPLVERTIDLFPS